MDSKSGSSPHQHLLEAECTIRHEWHRLTQADNSLSLSAGISPEAGRCGPGFGKGRRIGRGKGRTNCERALSFPTPFWEILLRGAIELSSKSQVWPMKHQFLAPPTRRRQGGSLVSTPFSFSFLRERLFSHFGCYLYRVLARVHGDGRGERGNGCHQAQPIAGARPFTSRDPHTTRMLPQKCIPHTTNSCKLGWKCRFLTYLKSPPYLSPLVWGCHGALNS